MKSRSRNKESRHSRRLTPWLLVPLLLLLSVALLRQPPVAATTTPSNLYLPLVQKLAFVAQDKRFGVVATRLPGGGQSVLSSLRVQSYYNYHWGAPVAGGERLQTVARGYTSEQGLDDFIRSNPGMYWQIGNEPNVPNQDNLAPVDYAQRYRLWVTRIKALDPTAKVLNGAIVNWPDVVGEDGAGLQYLKDFRDAYRGMYGQFPPVDVWNIHTFAPFYYADGKLHSLCDPTLPKRFIEQVAQYLRDAGESQPIWLTEFGLDWADDADPNCFVDPVRKTSTTTVAFMTDMVGWLKQTRLVDRWYWFSTNASGDGKGGSLVDLNGNLTELGRTYRDLASMPR